MYVSRLRLVNFRSYCDAHAVFGPGLNVVVGANATGKTNLLEGAWFALRGTSPRTRREEKLLRWGERFARVELELVMGSGRRAAVEMGYAPREGKRMRWDGLELTSLDELRRRSQVAIFVPESLLLVKGSPARRRAHLDTFAAALDPGYAAAARQLQEALRQRNAQLAAVRHGAAERSLDPWDVQFAAAAGELGRRRRDLIAELGARFSAAAGRLSPHEEHYAVELATQLAATGYETEAVVHELRRRRPGEVARSLTLFGPQRDDLRFLQVGGRAVAEAHDSAPAAAVVPGGAANREAQHSATGPVGPAAPAAGMAVRDEAPSCGPAAPPAEGRDLRLFGSQGEQRLAVLALLLAEQEVATARTGEPGILFLDDVMSELDDARRRLLVATLAAAGQAIITTTNRQYFTEDELADATVLQLPLAGALQAASPTDHRGEDDLEQPAVDAL